MYSKRIIFPKYAWSRQAVMLIYSKLSSLHLKTFSNEKIFLLIMYTSIFCGYTVSRITFVIKKSIQLNRANKSGTIDC